MLHSPFSLTTHQPTHSFLSLYELHEASLEGGPLSLLLGWCVRGPGCFAPLLKDCVEKLWWVGGWVGGLINCLMSGLA